MVESTITPVAQQLLTRFLGDADVVAGLVERLGVTFRRRIPEYSALPADVVETGIGHTLRAALVSTERARMPDATQLAGIASVTVERARKGVSLAAILDAYNLGAREFGAMLVAYGREHGYRDGDVLVTMQVVRRWMDDVTVAAATAHHQVGVERAREDEARTGAALRALLDHPVPAETATVHLVQLGLDPAGRYAGVRGRVGDEVSAAAVRDAFPAASVVAVVQRDVVGLVDTMPREVELLGTFGVGPFVPAVQLYESASAAGRAYAAATQLRRTGAHALDQLRLAAVAATDAETARIVDARLLAPLRARGRYGDDIWATVVTYLEHGMRVEETASSMHVHPNTLRHRLGQYAALTGADLRQPADIAETWWLATISPGGTADRRR